MSVSEAEAARETVDEAAGPSPGERGSGGFGAFANRTFLWFWTTLALSLTGSWVRITAQGWLVYELTDDRFLLGLVSFFQAAPVLFLSPIAGAVLDRVDRRAVLLWVQVIVAAAMLLLAILVSTDLIEVWQIMALAAIAGATSAFDWPARLSLMPSLVARSQLQSAVALTSAAFNVSRIIGPVIAGVLIGTVGVALCFYLNALAYLPFVLVLATLTVDFAQPKVTAKESAFANLIAGYRYIWRTPTIRGLLSVDIVPLMFGISYFTLAPAIAKDVLGLGGRGLGILLAINGIGSLLGTTLVAMLHGLRGRGRFVIVGVAVFGALVFLFGQSSSVVLSGALIFLLGFVGSTYGTLNDTLLQTNVDEAYRGRVLAVYSMFWGLTPIGAVEAGFVAERWGVDVALGVNGLLVLAYVPFLVRFSPVKRID